VGQSASKTKGCGIFIVHQEKKIVDCNSVPSCFLFFFFLFWSLNSFFFCRCIYLGLDLVVFLDACVGGFYGVEKHLCGSVGNGLKKLYEILFI
jgi:hypothetical protein